VAAYDLPGGGITSVTTGQLQDVGGSVFGTSKSSFMVGAGPSAVFAVCDAIFAPLAARQTLQARQAALQATANDSLLAVAEAYFNVQQARGRWPARRMPARRAEDVVAQDQEPGFQWPGQRRPRCRATKDGVYPAAPGRADSARAWRLASADLNLCAASGFGGPGSTAGAAASPHDVGCPGHLRRRIDRAGLAEPAELAAERAPDPGGPWTACGKNGFGHLIPSVLLRGGSTPVVGTLAGGYFGGGNQQHSEQLRARSDFDIQVLWTFENLGFGNLARGQGTQGRKPAGNDPSSSASRTRSRRKLSRPTPRCAQPRLVCRGRRGGQDAVLSADQNLAGLVGHQGACQAALSS